MQLARHKSSLTTLCKKIMGMPQGWPMLSMLDTLTLLFNVKKKRGNRLRRLWVCYRATLLVLYISLTCTFVGKFWSSTRKAKISHTEHFETHQTQDETDIFLSTSIRILKTKYKKKTNSLFEIWTINKSVKTTDVLFIIIYGLCWSNQLTHWLFVNLTVLIYVSGNLHYPKSFSKRCQAILTFFSVH